MLRKSTFIIIVSICQFSYSQNTLDVPELMPGVKKATYLFYAVNSVNGSYHDSLTTISNKHFNSNGYLVKEEFFNSIGELNIYWIYIYDDYSNLIERAQYRPNGDISWKINYLYLSGGLIKKTCYNPNGTIKWFYTILLNELGGKKEEKSHDPKGYITLHKKYSYNESGLLLSEVWLNNDATINSQKIYVYNHDGRKIQNISYDDQGVMTTKIEYSYDEHGNNTEQLWYVSGKMYWKWLFKYNESNHKVQGLYYKFIYQNNQAIEIPTEKVHYKYELY